MLVHEQADSNTPRSRGHLCSRHPGGRGSRQAGQVRGEDGGGHKVTFKLYGGKKIDDFETGIPTTCLPIQGGGTPMTGVDVWPNSWFLVNRTAKFQAMLTPAFYWNEVTNNFEVRTKKLRTGTIRGHLRKQYEFMVSKYPIGTFVIYSCLGEATFKAKPA